MVDGSKVNLKMKWSSSAWRRASASSKCKGGERTPYYNGWMDYYKNHNTYKIVCELKPGPHTFVTRDTYGDGWHGGTWEVIGKHTATTVAGKGTTTTFNV